jgi:hypothetical protein
MNIALGIFVTCIMVLVVVVMALATLMCINDIIQEIRYMRGKNEHKS